MKKFNIQNENKVHISMLVIFFIFLIWSAINPPSYLSWFGEAFPAVALITLTVATYRKFTFSTFVYAIILVLAIIMCIGAKYTYAGNPLFEIIKEMTDSSRNQFDRVGHFMQGFGPAFIVREFIIRKGYLKRGKLLSFTVVSFCLAFSAFYEILEFATSLITGIPGHIVLAFQGDVWDSQWDMVMALSGATIAVVVFGRLHDKFIEKTISQNKNKVA